MLIILDITVEQEIAIRLIFKHHGWTLHNLGDGLPETLQKKILKNQATIAETGTNTRTTAICENEDGQEAQYSVNNNATELVKQTEQNLPCTAAPCTDAACEILGCYSNALLEQAEYEHNKEKCIVESKEINSSCNEYSVGTRETMSLFKVPDPNVLRRDQQTAIELENGSSKAKTEMGNQSMLKSSVSDLLHDVTNTQLTLDGEKTSSRPKEDDVENEKGYLGICKVATKSKDSKPLVDDLQKLRHLDTFACSLCDKVFKSRTGLFYHVKGAHKRRYSYCCEKCNKKFLYKPHYDGHMNKHNKIRPFICEKCDKTFTYKQALNLHRKTCMYRTLPVVNHSTKPATKSKVLCDICGAELSSKSALKQHLSFMHSNKPSLVCSQCGRCFKTDTTLRRHMKVLHEDGQLRTYSCDVCNQMFKQSQVLRQHMKIHTKDFNNYCETCGKGFYTHFKLKEHQRIHTGEKPHSCPICLHFKCSTKSNMLKHVKTHNTTGDDGTARRRVRNVKISCKMAKLPVTETGVMVASPLTCLTATHVSTSNNNQQIHQSLSKTDINCARVSDVNNRTVSTVTIDTVSSINTTVTANMPRPTDNYHTSSSYHVGLSCQFQGHGTETCQGEIHDGQGQIHNNQGQIHDDQGQMHDDQGQILDGQGQIHNVQGQIHNRQSEIRYANLSSLLPQGSAASVIGTSQYVGPHPQYHMVTNGRAELEYEDENANGYYGNMPSDDNQTSQGLNILTTAMNIVNPNQY